ncbi:hypothetical protein AbraIFM66951_009799 [Aspergillus brasiliensis]|uniref:F-box domain-containing protein n=1 Tax=Aspergillus brasiliensis TaxID=319629 RepID=A0A9W6DJP1_9EURO|nr:hypothetical protein AbraCBS73388_004716 [Aspergillus brasiliensis]GKZ46660.1 hypothetical protein AbraIFM66951_009799 [Aspergillus brasiliensis]
MAVQPQNPFVHLPLEILEMIIEYVDIDKYRVKCFRRAPYLRDLRQVDRLFCAIASRELFATCTVYINDSKFIFPKDHGGKRKRKRRANHQKKSALPFADFEIFRTENNNVARQVRTLTIKCRGGSWNRDYIEPYGKTLVRTYLPLFVRLRRLEFHTLESPFGPQVKWDARCLAKPLIEGLEGYMPPYLDELDFIHPIIRSSPTPEFGFLPSVMARLRHFGSALWTYDDHPRGPERTNVFDSLRHGERLISVKIEGQSEDIAPWETVHRAPLCPSIVHPDAPLRSFSLHSVTISAFRLAGLRHFRKSLRNVTLKYVKLDIGHWDEVFQALNGLEGLTDLAVWECGYDASASGKMLLSPFGWNYRLISPRDQDHLAMDELVAATKRRRNEAIRGKMFPRAVNSFQRAVVRNVV